MTGIVWTKAMPEPFTGKVMTRYFLLFRSTGQFCMFCNMAQCLTSVAQSILDLDTLPPRWAVSCSVIAEIQVRETLSRAIYKVKLKKWLFQCNSDIWCAHFTSMLLSSTSLCSSENSDFGNYPLLTG